MSHRSPARGSLARPYSSPGARGGSSSSGSGGGGGGGSSHYAHLHTTLTTADSESDDDVDPRWTNPKVLAAAAAASASPRSGREGAPYSSRATFTRSGYAPAADPLHSSYLNTSGATGTTGMDAATVQQAWARGIGTLDEGYSHTQQTDDEYAGIPQPKVDLAGMTDEQRELLEYLQARVGQSAMHEATHSNDKERS